MGAEGLVLGRRQSAKQYLCHLANSLSFVRQSGLHSPNIRADDWKEPCNSRESTRLQVLEDRPLDACRRVKKSPRAVSTGWPHPGDFRIHALIPKDNCKGSRRQQCPKAAVAPNSVRCSAVPNKGTTDSDMLPLIHGTVCMCACVRICVHVCLYLGSEQTCSPQIQSILTPGPRGKGWTSSWTHGNCSVQIHSGSGMVALA